MSPSRVLVIDDDPALLQALPAALRIRMAAVTVDTADSAAAALDRIAATDYDAIVTDIKMPGMDGVALLSEIRTRRPDTPVLMITGHGGHALAVQALRGGADDFIQKPIDRDYFVESLRRAIQEHALNRRVKDRELALRRCANELEQIAARLGSDQPRVLIVDDDPALLEALPHTLRLRMAECSRAVYDCHLTCEDMLERYERLILNVWRTTARPRWTISSRGLSLPSSADRMSSVSL